jgi:hypothetical protein
MQQLAMTWTGLQPPGHAALPLAVVTLTVRLDPSTSLSTWRFAASGLGEYGADAVACPRIAGIGSLGGDANDLRLLVPEKSGRLYSNPGNNLPNLTLRYPSTAEMQFAALYNSKAGFFFATRDVTGQTKDFNWSSYPVNQGMFQVAHYYPEQAADSVTVPYDIAIGSFQGDWQSAAGLYRSWAAEQTWATQSTTESSPLAGVPIARLAVGDAVGQGAVVNTYQSTVDWSQDNPGVLKSPVFTELWGWEKLGEWYYGDYFPPYEGWAAFDSLVQGLHKENSLLQVLVSGYCIVQATPLWQSGIPAAYAASSESGDQYTWTINQNPLQICQFMSIGSQYWQQQLAANITTLATHGVDSVQLDNWPVTQTMDDFSAGHPRGQGGTWQTDAWIATLGAIRHATASINPKFTLGSEQAAEVFLPFVDIYDTFDCWAELSDTNVGKGIAQAVPLLNFVYHSHVIGRCGYFYGLYNDSYDALLFGRALTWGQMPEFNQPNSLTVNWVSQKMVQYLADIGKARSTFLSEYLVQGTMLRAPSISSPAFPVTISSDSTPGPVQMFPSILASAWRSPTGDTGVVLTNVSPQSVTTSVPIDFDRLELNRGSSYTVSLEDAQGTSIIASGVTGSTAAPVTVKPYGIVALTVSCVTQKPDPWRPLTGCVRREASGAPVVK